LDSEPQFLDCLNQVVAFRGEGGVLGLNLSQFFLSAKVDGAQAFTFTPQALKLFFDFHKIRQGIGRTDFGQLCNCGRFNFQHVADFSPNIAEPALGALETLLGAGKFFTSGAGGFKRGSGVAIGRGECHFGGLQPVGALTPRAFGSLDLSGKCTPFLAENLRRVLQLRTVAPGFSNALFERGDLISSAMLTFDPTCPVSSQGREPAIGKFGFTDNRLQVSLGLRQPCAFRGDFIAHVCELCFEMGCRSKADQRLFSFSFGRGSFIPARPKTCTRFNQSR
jgi:hypothetical protein